jgi:hypothetical protein
VEVPIFTSRRGQKDLDLQKISKPIPIPKKKAPRKKAVVVKLER